MAVPQDPPALLPGTVSAPASRQGSKELLKDLPKLASPSPRNSLSLPAGHGSNGSPTFPASLDARVGNRKRSVVVPVKIKLAPEMHDASEQNSEYSGEGPQLSRAMSIATNNSEEAEPSNISYLDNILRYEFRRGVEDRGDPSDFSDQRTLQRSQSWRSLTQAEEQEGIHTVWTQGGLEKQHIDNPDEEIGPIQDFCKDLHNRRAWTAVYVFFTAYALFATDIDSIAGDKSSWIGIGICTTIAALAFLIELIVHGIGKQGYIYSAFFILDLVAFISLIPDTIIMQLATDDNAFVAGRSSRLTRMLRLFGRSARAARLNRFGRIARIAALMPKLQELQRFWGHRVEDEDASRVLEKKLYRIFCFVDEDMDGYISKSALGQCKDKLFDLARIEKKKPEWASKLRMLAAAASVPRVRQLTDPSGQMSVSQSNSQQLLSPASENPDASTSGASMPSPKKEAAARQQDSVELRRVTEKPFNDSVEYVAFRDAIMNEPPLLQWLKNSVVKQLKRGNNMQAVRQRNAEYIGVKVAMAILLIILVLSYVEMLYEDTSLSYGFATLNTFVRITYGTPSVGAEVPEAVRRQVNSWGVQDGWNRPDRPLLYLDVRRRVYCNSFAADMPCSLPLSLPIQWAPTKTLEEVDREVLASNHRTLDLLLLRYPDFSDQDISAEELENKTEAVALFLNRADTVARARDSILTTWGVLFLIMVGISLLTRDLTYLSKNLLKPLVELSDEVESITRLQLAATTKAAHDESQDVTSEIRLLRRRFDNMKTAIRSWGKYVPWPVVQLMMRKDAQANIEVSNRKITIFFSDIASFTTIVESLPPKSSLLLLSRYFQEMSRIVDQHGGIVVEFIGDAVLCIYGAPVVNENHPTVAVMAAVEMLAAMSGINSWLSRRGLPKISIRCGIHTGQVLVGNMGMQSRMKYGIVGDECSMPGRLEELNKTYGTQLLVSEATHSEMEIEGLVSRPIDFIHGNEENQEAESQQIFEVWKSNRRAGKAALEEKAADLYTEAVEHYRHGRFQEAIDGFTASGEAMYKLTGNQDMASQLMLQRCTSYMANPPREDWDGVWDRNDEK
ncbi:unnamed protein product [Effrenium voratum]|nr:unnamed protein product [Effrenium voratum]